MTLSVVILARHVEPDMQPLIENDATQVHEKPWNKAIAAGGSHCIVLSSRVMVCQNFLQHAERIAELHPHDPICLLSAGELFREAYKQGKSWCASIDGVSADAMLLPRELAQKWQGWTTWAAKPTDDKDSMTAYFWSFDKRIIHPVPPLATWRMKPGWMADETSQWTATSVVEHKGLLHGIDPARILQYILQDGIKSHFDYTNHCWTTEAAEQFAP